MNENKEQQNIDELLNAYLDDELDEIRQTELKRLLQDDGNMQARLAALAACRGLIAALPAEKAPANTLEAIRARLERKVLLDEYSRSTESFAGKRHLMYRWALTAAAIFIVAGVLIWVLATILAPMPAGDSYYAMDKQPVRQIESLNDEDKTADSAKQEQAEPLMAVKDDLQADSAVSQQRQNFMNIRFVAAQPLLADLQLRTNAVVAVDRFVAKAIYLYDLLDSTSIDRQPERITYRISCDRPLSVILAGELEPVWKKCEQVDFSISGGTVGRSFTVPRAAAFQVAELLREELADKRQKMAKDFAAMNKVIADEEYHKLAERTMPLSPDMIEPPKPAMTGAAREQAGNSKKSEDPVTLTITIIPH